jgi:hypothetical protein
MIECIDIFWHHFYKGAGVMLGAVLPLLFGFGVMVLAIFRQQHRHHWDIPMCRAATTGFLNRVAQRITIHLSGPATPPTERR